MGQYYDTGPYTLAQWNKLIQYANSVLQNPPANTTWHPVPPSLAQPVKITSGPPRTLQPCV